MPGAIRDHRDVLGAAQTGSGKTLAFGIPLVNHLIENKRRNEMNNSSSSAVAATEAVVKVSLVLLFGFR